MGCDIHAYAEVRTPSGSWALDDGPEPDSKLAEHYGDAIFYQDYGVFGFLADVRNYSHVPVIAQPRGLPDGASVQVHDEYEEWGTDAHSASWLTLAELRAYDYDQVIWDRRVIKETSPGSGSFNGAALADEGEGKHLPLREFLPDWYFRALDRLAALGAPEDVRVVFWFDN